MHSLLKNDLSLRSIAIAAAMVMLTINLDLFAVLAALPAAALQFSVTTTDLQWVISGCMLALTPCLVDGSLGAIGMGRGINNVVMFVACSSAAGTGQCGSFASVVTQAVLPAQKAGSAADR
jgi:hypothetical protein